VNIPEEEFSIETISEETGETNDRTTAGALIK
jgi:hypothetical protein